MKRIYGNVRTALDLTGKALAYYNMCDPITIIEDADDETGECRYQVLSGREPMHDGWMTADALIRWMEDGYDEATGSTGDDPDDDHDNNRGGQHRENQ